MPAQDQLAQAHFVVVGAGGLGCPALLGLSAGGAQRITIIDPDRVETSNLQRQVLYALADVGRPKAEAAAWSLARRVPSLKAAARVRAVAPGEADAFVAGLPADSIVLECTDAPPLKFALNDAGLRHGTPVIIGAALGLHGQCIAVLRGQACYRCIYESPPPAEDLPTCATAGVLGVAVGLAGFMMANLALALASGNADPETTGTLTAFDIGRSSVRSLRPASRPACSACAAATPTRFPPLQASA
ncbi:MAG: HesA/MoeB/ThiF family protein [Nannocystales bacterium]